MVDLIVSNGTEIIGYILTLTLVAIVGKIRAVSDQNLISTFESFKSIASKVNFKEKDITNSILKIDSTVNKLQNNLDESINNMNESILAFTEGELYQKMLTGLSQLDALNQTLQNKDNIIQDLKVELKEINKRLGVILNERKL